MNEDRNAAMGFTGIQAANVMEALRSRVIKELEDRFARMDAARDASLPYIRSSQQREDEQRPPSEVERAAVHEVVHALEELTTNIAQAYIIDPDAVAGQTGYQRSTVDAVLDAFTVRELADIDEMLDVFPW